MVRWTIRARDDLQAIHQYIAKDSPMNAKDVIRAFIENALTLDRTPRAGRVVPEIGEDDIREIPIHSWRLIYQVRGAEVNVLTLVHKRRARASIER